MGGTGADVLSEAVSYEPVMYRIVNDLESAKRSFKDESQVDI